MIRRSGDARWREKDMVVAIVKKKRKKRVPRKQTIERLCTRHHNENVHTEHVAALALQMFDGVAPLCALPATSRLLLETAARLHDIGYARAPGDHVRAGAAIIQSSRVGGMSQAERRVVAAIVLLHSARWEDYAKLPIVRGLSDRALVMKLGAMLRVADALDHGHVQNARIASIRCRGRGAVIRVRSPGMEINLDRARAKADLWQRVMPLKLELRRVAVAKPETPYGHLLTPDLSALEAARRLLYFYFCSITLHAKLALVEDDPIHLHDIRVGIRRFRSVLRLFRTELAPTSAEFINGHLRTLSQRLGPPRDADAWLELLDTVNVPRRTVRDARWKSYVARHRRAVSANLRPLRRLLAGDTYREARLRMAVLLRTEIPELMRGQRPRMARNVLANRLRKNVRRVADLGVFRKNLDVETMHDLRILCRRGRYWTEFAAPILGPGTVVLARRLKDVADALGHLHDLDVGIAQLRDDEAAPRVVRGMLREARRRALQESARAWRRLHGKKTIKQALRELAR